MFISIYLHIHISFTTQILAISRTIYDFILKIYEFRLSNDLHETTVLL